MKTNYVKANLRAGKPSVGTWLTLASPIAARFMARLRFDWLTVDMEHNPIDIETAATMFAVIADAGCVPLARVPWNTAENIKRVLDNGAWGIVVPMVNSRAEAEAAVAAAKYPPVGNRSVGGNLHALSFGGDTAEYYAHANDEILVIIQAEHVDAIEHADEILSVPGVDAVFIGPNDLLASMGQTPRMETDYKPFVDALAHTRTTANKYGVAPGIHVADAEAVNRRIGEGFQFIALASESGLMVRIARDQIGEVLKVQGKAEEKGEVVRY